MNILVTTDPELPVPPRFYGGIERIVDLLVRGLVDRGHRVVLMAHRDSNAPAELVPYRGRRSQNTGDVALHAAQLFRAVRAHGVDLVHSFGRLVYLLPILGTRVPKIQSYQRAVTPRSVRWANRLARGTLSFSACSDWLARSGALHGGCWTAIPNAVPRDVFTPVVEVPTDAPLAFLGRLERIKGVHTAIEVALRTGKRLVIAGNVVRDGGAAERYFEEEIRPKIDGEQVRYLGPVDDRQKNELLGGAAALLMPIEWEEPFGIVMAEALACGTPVLAFRRGAAPEVVESGASGYLCSDADEMIASVRMLPALSRAACRRRFEEHFADDVVVDRYEDLYRVRIRGCRGDRP